MLVAEEGRIAARLARLCAGGTLVRVGERLLDAEQRFLALDLELMPLFFVVVH